MREPTERQRAHRDRKAALPPLVRVQTTVAPRKNARRLAEVARAS